MVCYIKAKNGVAHVHDVVVTMQAGRPTVLQIHSRVK